MPCHGTSDTLLFAPSATKKRRLWPRCLDWVQMHCGGAQALLLVYNDAVTALVSGTEGRLEGCVLIAGTGQLLYAP